jgi:hypothetical protein
VPSPLTGREVGYTKPGCWKPDAPFLLSARLLLTDVLNTYGNAPDDWTEAPYLVQTHSCGPALQIVESVDGARRYEAGTGHCAWGYYGVLAKPSPLLTLTETV